MRRMVGDRRDKARFDVVGELWGRIDMTVPVLVQNICRGGALLDSPSLLARNSVHRVSILADGQRHFVQIRVRHSGPKSGAVGPQRYSIGVEFLSLPQAVQDALGPDAVENDDGPVEV